MKVPLVLSMLMLLGCQEPVELSIKQIDNGKISIEVVGAGKDKPCTYGVAISHTVNGKIYSDWGIDLEDKNMPYCQSKFTYPDVPPHYYLSQAPKALKPGEKYEVSVTGVGFGAGEKFIRTGS